MRWDDPSIAGFAYRAGFRSGDQATAVAIALATSGGDDAYEYSPLFGPRHHWVGLWGVDILEFPQFDASLMRNPVYCAEAAYFIWAATGTSWAWSQAFTSGAYKRYAAEGAFATSLPSATQYGFAVAGDDLDSRGLSGLASTGHSAVSALESVVRAI